MFGALRVDFGSAAQHDPAAPGPVLVKFLDHITICDRVWICTGRQIAEHWRRVHPG